MIDDTDAWPLATALVQTLNIEASRSNPIDRIYLFPGELAVFDEACYPFGWVRVTNIFPTATFPTPVGNPALSCASSLAVTLEAGIMRCAPQPRQLGRGQIEAPSTTEQRDAARAQLADMALIRRAILAVPCEDKALGTYLPSGPMGGLVGGYWTTILGV